MNKKIIAIISTFGLFTISPVLSFSQTTQKVQSVVEASVPVDMSIGKVGVKKVDINKKHKQILVTLKDNYSDVPFTKESISQLKDQIKAELGEKYSSYKVRLKIGSTDIEKYFTPITHKKDNNERFVTELSNDKEIEKGLDGNIIALWQSHGWYFEPKLNRWEWQRARIFQTVEDLFTQSFVMPYLMPMLENAGAYVMSPRERDTNSTEIIIDNDGGNAVNGYVEKNGEEKWEKSDKPGFAYLRSQYENNQNPFSEGTIREVKAETEKNKVARASWNAEIPKRGEYAVYISYATLPHSAPDAEYTINYLGGSKKFVVNQNMGGNTWIYLGHFQLEKGTSKAPIVELSNYSKHKHAVVSADAIKIGGGYGNIARKVIGESDNIKSSENTGKETTKNNKKNDKATENIPTIDYQYQLSGYPRYTEGARYWLQWAGVPDSIYSPSQNVNDYTDDYRCRGTWVNYLAGGSRRLPKYGGLNIPVDLAMAFHSDAGTTMNDSIIGTLGIYYSDNFGKYVDGTSRTDSRILTNNIMTNIVNDIRAQYEPNWKRRGMWDKSYYEARVPEVPTMLLELLSHQNFADMKYGLDPTFRFTVSRAIYKGMLQFLAEREKREYVVQPLPVNSFMITKSDAGKFLLSWKATQDTLCDNADAKEYYLYERINDGAFVEIAKTTEPYYVVKVNDNKIHSYQVIAANEGGHSFPSEILSLGLAKNAKGTVMVVNGFTRISAPDWFDAGEIAGFYDARDHGVPYIKDINFIGSQFEYRRNIPWMDDDAAGFGASRANYETKVVAGNTFDYPYIHGESIMQAGYSFISSSLQAVEEGNINLNEFKALDLILGKQKETIIGRGAVANKFKIFSPAIQTALTTYTSNGGNVFVSGAFVATDLWDKKEPVKEDIKFAENVLGYKWRVGQASVTGEAYSVPTIFKDLATGEYKFYNELNEDCYAVESPDSLYPSDSKTGYTFMRYKENNLVAGIVTSKKGYKTCVLGFPFETIKDGNSRGQLMTQILNFFENNNVNYITK
ncbi:MAG: xanthan lyase [Muribaculaceae bacterium]|nr:xanthan lyase [Muribaculaceae bacterium]